MSIDLLIRGGDVIDGTGQARCRADAAIDGGRIIAIGPDLTLPARQTLDAGGQVVAPGLIDCHTHDDTAITDPQRMAPKLLQGVTTVVAGNCGLSAAPYTRDGAPPPPLDILDRRGLSTRDFAAFLSEVAQRGPQVNAGFLLGLTTVRVEVMADVGREATPAEVAAMNQLVKAAIDAGAIGVSAGPFYRPARASTVDEVVGACSGALQADRHVFTIHLRNEGDDILDAMEEATQMAARLQVPLVISHHKLMGRANHGRSAQTLERLEQYARLQPVCMDCYPYSAASTMLHPDMVKVSSRVQVAWSTPYPQYAGHDLEDVAVALQCDREEAARRLSPGGGIYFTMDMADVRSILSHPLTMVASDGLPHDTCPHPRLWGSFPRVLGRMAREDRWFSLETAVHKMTGMPAARFNLRNRGVLAVGAAADVVVFDPDRVIDIASYASPLQGPHGIEAVIVNGHLKVRRGDIDLQASGQVLRTH